MSAAESGRLGSLGSSPTMRRLNVPSDQVHEKTSEEYEEEARQLFLKQKAAEIAREKEAQELEKQLAGLSEEEKEQLLQQRSEKAAADRAARRLASLNIESEVDAFKGDDEEHLIQATKVIRHLTLPPLPKEGIKMKKTNLVDETGQHKLLTAKEIKAADEAAQRKAEEWKKEMDGKKGARRVPVSPDNSLTKMDNMNEEQREQERMDAEKARRRIKEIAAENKLRKLKSPLDMPDANRRKTIAAPNMEASSVPEFPGKILRAASAGSMSKIPVTDNAEETTMVTNGTGESASNEAGEGATQGEGGGGEGAKALAGARKLSKEEKVAEKERLKVEKEQLKAEKQRLKAEKKAEKEREKEKKRLEKEAKAQAKKDAKQKK